MEISVFSCSQTSVGKKESPIWKVGLCNSKQMYLKTDRICFDLTRKWKRESIQVRSEISVSETFVGNNKSIGRRSLQKKADDRVRLFVGLPLDVVSHCNNINLSRAITAGLKALKLLNIEGVELPIWWGIVEKEEAGKYDWSAYLTLADMVRDAGLKLRISLCFHASTDPAIPLPIWVSRIGETRPDIFFADRAGRRYRECLSLGVDDVPVLEGKTPMRVFKEFMESFRSSFSGFMGSTITDITVGLGPDGELRYPSIPSVRGSRQNPGVGEFQCYDKHMLNHLKQHAETTGNSCWGHSGPHDTPASDQSPDSNSFFRENGGSWETPYGHFFLSWYSSQLLSHGNRLLSLASAIFRDSPVMLSGKVPLMHSWYKTRSHPSELTAGFHNTATREGYNAVAEMFARNSCQMILPGMNLCDENQPQGLYSSPESLLRQIMEACKKHEVGVTGENSSITINNDSFRKIKERLSPDNVGVHSFTYQRMGAYFFSPEHWPLFMDLIRSQAAGVGFRRFSWFFDNLFNLCFRIRKKFTDANSLVGFRKIKERLSPDNVGVHSFTYQRMWAYFDLIRSQAAGVGLIRRFSWFFDNLFNFSFRIRKKFTDANSLRNPFTFL
ncbi:beta-amylase 3 [Tasmannia lanceolata]|uniref:beta-amylase 3 n=1 Tax=Tasmannia lanceolata TaxID=3420 RepID=UPI00406336BD